MPHGTAIGSRRCRDDYAAGSRGRRSLDPQGSSAELGLRVPEPLSKSDTYRHSSIRPCPARLQLGLDHSAYGTHSMRRTRPSLINRRTKNLRAVQLLLGHSKFELTVRYLGIDVDDALELAEQTEV